MSNSATKIGMLEVQALRGTADFDVQVSLNALESNFFAGFTDSEIDFAKSAHADAATDRVLR